MSNLNIPFCWFTCGPDARILVQSMRSVRHLYPTAPLYVFIDGNNQFASHKMGIIFKKLNASVVPTVWSRGGNLRGIAAHEGIVNSLLWACEMEGSKCAIKIDSDVLYVKKGMIEEFIKSKKPMGGLESACGKGVCGPTYAVRKESLEKLKMLNALLIPSPYNTEEDYEMSNRIIITEGNNDCFFKLPYSFNGIGPWKKDAKAGIFIYDQDSEKNRKFIKKNWQICVWHTRPPGKYTGNPQDQEALMKYLIKMNGRRARSMRAVRRVVQGESGIDTEKN